MPPPTTNGGKWAETWGYKLGNDANATALPGVIQRFLGTRQRAEDAKTFVQELREVFATQREYVFYSSSLLLVYDASLGDAAQLRIKMIDFGHVHPWEPSDDPRYPEGGNDGYLYAPPRGPTSSWTRTLLNTVACVQVWHRYADRYPGSYGRRYCCGCRLGGIRRAMGSEWEVGWASTMRQSTDRCSNTTAVLHLLRTSMSLPHRCGLMTRCASFICCSSARVPVIASAIVYPHVALQG